MNGFQFGQPQGENVLCLFCGLVEDDGHLFKECTVPLVHLQDQPEFALFGELDRAIWPRCLKWHGWLPGRFGSCVDSLSAADMLHRPIGLSLLLAYPLDPMDRTHLVREFEAEEMADFMP